ncbi:hypothetical protein AGRA3207_006134 [Actinomadura graeca]|uniref:Sigma-70 family RNA polymerase sigma factor n=1 Tax=Actinomadura graeca TaxID=2750812 RepID=A0ABX8R394_9ACTN|nr:RNA polymerase sigma factor [Actinomadura graeca]QXJ24744.1 hypothetical protein AGRA3207_006134 [Actinomadura graeca]
MRGDLGSLYDAHSARLYAYCWSLVGDAEAASAVGDTFAAAVHQPPRGDSVLWLYSLARTACAGRGAPGHMPDRAPHGRQTPHGRHTPDGRGAPLFTGTDPLLRAAAGLRSDHREVLLLWAGEWLEPYDIARVLGIAPDTVAQLLHAARTRLERAVLDTLMRGAPHHDLITAFEKGTLPRLLAERAPSRPPAWLRDRVLAACEEEAVRPLPSVAAPSPLIVIGPGTGARHDRGSGLSKGAGAVAGLAASAAAVLGLLATWPTAKGGSAASLMPTASTGRTEQASTGASGTGGLPPGLTGAERGTHPGAPATAAGGDTPQPAGTSPGGTVPGTPARSPSGTPAPREEPVTPKPGKPSTPGKPSPSPGTPTTSPTGPTGPTTPPGPTEPTTPPGTPTDPPAQEPGTSSPSPTSNPAPSPTSNAAPDPGEG